METNRVVKEDKKMESNKEEDTQNTNNEDEGEDEGGRYKDGIGTKEGKK